MDTFPESTEQLSALKRAYLALQKMQSKLDKIEQAKTEPIAIIGMGCRFPGHANSPEAFWDLLKQGRDAITEVPNDRWNIDSYYNPDSTADGKMVSRWGGFLDQVDQFDSLFFRISPRETVSMDPQQRLLLEVSWEALEQAGQVPSTLVGSHTGVFIGICSNDYSQLLLSQGATAINAYMGTGSAHSVASGRLSYVFGLQGPSISVDTACSSSLLSVHLACQSLRNEECSMALAGGVNLILSPEVTINFSKAGMLSPDGHCKTFDATANGYVRGEGCGVVVLKRLSNAIADGDNILALIRGSATNQDGLSGGLTVPNASSQQALIHQTLASAGIKPSQVQYIEAHGTGTALGDPIEARALSAVFAADRPADEPLLLGSVKTNIGHLEGAAGIAGLIKVVLSLHHRTIPPHLHFQSLNPYIDWGTLPVQIPTTLTDWHTEKKLIAGVSSFGFSGTNAHILLEAAPVVKTIADVTPQVLVLSAKTATALKKSTINLAQYLRQHSDVNLADVAYTLQVSRETFSHRWMSVCQNVNDAIKALDEFDLNQCSTCFQEVEERTVVFLFPSHIPQLSGLTQTLYETELVFQEQVDRSCEWVQDRLGVDLRHWLYPNLANFISISIEDTNFQTDFVFSQLAIFTIEYALAKQWMSWGIQPKAMIGSQVGEYVAACLAGVFSLEDSLLLLLDRSRLLDVLTQASRSLTSSEISDWQRNGSTTSNKCSALRIFPESTQLMTDTQQSCQKQFEQVFHERSEQAIASLLEALMQKIATIKLNSPQIPYLSTTTGGWITAETATNPRYWVNQLCQPSCSMDTVTEIFNDSTHVLLDIGVGPIFESLSRQPNTESNKLRLASLHHSADLQSKSTTLLHTMGQLWLAGLPLNWASIYASSDKLSRHRIPLPTYPFERKRYWIES
jgi:microcystin synthetase protein McyG